MKSLEKARDHKLISKPSTARVDLYLGNKGQQRLNSLNTNVRQVLMVSQLRIHSIANAPQGVDQYGQRVAVKVTQAQGKTCQRCRMVKNDVGTDSAYPTFCARCARIVRKHFPQTVKNGFDDVK